MTNAEKYKTDEERETKFFEFCGNEWCDRCYHSECVLWYAGEDGLLHCYDSWLASEAGELRSRLNHNAPKPGGVARAVTAAKESEAKDD